QTLEDGNQRIFARPQGGVVAIEFALVTVQRRSRFDLAGIEIDSKDQGFGKAQIDDFLEENREDLLGALRGEDPQSGRICARAARGERRIRSSVHTRARHLSWSPHNCDNPSSPASSA